MGASAETFYNADAYHTYGLRNSVHRPISSNTFPEIYNSDEPYTPEEYASLATQYYARDDNGQATFGYAHPGQAAYNYRDEYGNQIGSWAYFNPEGKEIRVSYIADSKGFRVLSNELPVAPIAVTETPEVATARAAHMAAYEAIKNRITSSSPYEDIPESPVSKRSRAFKRILKA